MKDAFLGAAMIVLVPILFGIALAGLRQTSWKFNRRERLRRLEDESSELSKYRDRL